MPKVTQVKADVPHELKCRVFSVLALRDQRFNRWVTDCMEAFLQQVESEQQTPRDAPLVASTTGTLDASSGARRPQRQDKKKAV